MIRLGRDKAMDELVTAHRARPTPDRLERRHRTPIHGDRDGLAGLDARQQSAGVVAELSGGHIRHAATVAHVRRLSQPPSSDDVLDDTVGRGLANHDRIVIAELRIVDDERADARRGVIKDGHVPDPCGRLDEEVAR